MDPEWAIELHKPRPRITAEQACERASSIFCWASHLFVTTPEHTDRLYEQVLEAVTAAGRQPIVTLNGYHSDGFLPVLGRLFGALHSFHGLPAPDPFEPPDHNIWSLAEPIYAGAENLPSAYKQLRYEDTPRVISRNLSPEAACNMFARGRDLMWELGYPFTVVASVEEKNSYLLSVSDSFFYDGGIFIVDLD